METSNIINILSNSGIKVCGADSEFLYFQDPSCVLPAFDTFVGYAWTVICLLTAFMLLGWAILYIRNGVKIDSLFKNAKSVILIFSVLSIVIPIINYMYGGNLFEKHSNSENITCEDQYKLCETHKVSLSKINELYNQRKANLKISDEYFLYENFNVTVSDEYEDETEE